MTTSMAMEKQQKLLADAANFQDSSVDQVVRILGTVKSSNTEKHSLSDELEKHRHLALDRARMEADFEHKISALKKIKDALARAPDLDVELQFQTEVAKLEEEEGPTDRDLENTDPMIRKIDLKLSSIRQ